MLFSIMNTLTRKQKLLVWASYLLFQVWTIHKLSHPRIMHFRLGFLNDNKIDIFGPDNSLCGYFMLFISRVCLHLPHATLACHSKIPLDLSIRITPASIPSSSAFTHWTLLKFKCKDWAQSCVVQKSKQRSFVTCFIATFHISLLSKDKSK